MKGPVNRKLQLFGFDINRSVAAPEFDGGRLEQRSPTPGPWTSTAPWVIWYRAARTE